MSPSGRGPGSTSERCSGRRRTPSLWAPAAIIQDNCVLHADPGFPTKVGRDCTVGHAAILHGCTIGDNTLVGMGAIVLNGAVVGRDCIIAAGALVTQGAVIPTGAWSWGPPARSAAP